MSAATVEFPKPSTSMPANGKAVSLIDPKYGYHDSANAERLLAMHGHDVRYCHALKKWLVFNGKHWKIDDSGLIEKRAKVTMVEFLRQAVAHDSEAGRKFATASLEASRINGMLSMAKCEVPVKPEDLDGHPFLLNFQNGCLDLTTMELGPHKREHMLTKAIEHDYNPDACCPTFLAFLERIMGVHEGASKSELKRAKRLISCLKKAIGYSLTGSTREKAVFFAWGGGDNGKTTLLALLLRLLGPYGTMVQVDSLMQKQFGESANSLADLADLRGARFVMTSETEEGQRLAEAKLKRITQGMGLVKTVRKYENPVIFPETHHLWIDCNHRPVIRGTDAAIWNRLHLLPFSVTIPKNEIDRELPNKLAAEAEGILGWAVEGCREWQRSGLERPPEMEKARTRWRKESDTLQEFVDEQCALGADHVCLMSEMRQVYMSWCARRSIREPLSSQQFNDRLRAMEGVKESKRRLRRGYSERIWDGITVLTR